MSEDSETDFPLSTSNHALNVDIVVERILSFLIEYPEEILKCRLLCHKWNDIIVPKINLVRMSFKIPLRYEHHVPQSIDISGGRRGAGEVLDTAICTLTGTAARLHFDVLIIEHDFYLAGVIPEFTKFLEIQGQSIHRLKIKIRPEISPKENENHVMDCAEVVSMESLRALFRATPNLKYLSFCVRFSHYEEHGAVEQRCIYPFTLPPQLKHLTEIKIIEPDGVQYSVELLKKLMSLSPNLNYLKITPWKRLLNFARAIKAMSPWIQDSLTKLFIANARVDATYLLLEKGIMEFSYLTCLSSLLLNKISGEEKYNWIRSLLRALQSNLKILVLGQEKSNNGEGEDWNVDLEIDETEEESLFPPVMKNLEYLDICLKEFNVREHVTVESYNTQFPSLTTLRITGSPDEKWTLEKLDHMLPGVEGESQSLENFDLVGSFDSEDDKNQVVYDVSVTFPMAIINFDFISSPP